MVPSLGEWAGTDAGAHNQLLCEGTVFGPSKKAALSLQFCAAGVGGALTGTVCPVEVPAGRGPVYPNSSSCDLAAKPQRKRNCSRG